MAKLYFYYSTMNAGKSTMLLQASYNYRERGMNPLILAPVIDNRDGEKNVSSRIGLKAPAISFYTTDQLFTLVESEHDRETIDCVLVDEAQFFSSSIIKDSLKLKSMGKRIIIAGLNKDYLNKEFKSVSGLIKIADKLTKLYAVCNRCSAPASRSYRIVKEKSTILLGHKDAYEPLCKKCYENAR